MDLVWLVLVVVATTLAIVAFLWFRKRQVERARDRLQQAHAVLLGIEGAVQSFVATGEYMPERVRWPLHTQLVQLMERDLPPVARVVSSVRDTAMREQLDGFLRHSGELRHVLEEHNNQYVKRMVTEHSKLLVEELRTDE